MSAILPRNTQSEGNAPKSESKFAKFYGPGGATENLSANAIPELVNAIFALHLGVGPELVGLTLALPRFIDAFTDPLMGWVSDNWKGRWGRRRPFIGLGAFISGLCVALVWWTPEAASKDFQFYWLMSFMVIMTLGTTSFGVPFAALGMETPRSKSERTTWMAWRSFYQKVSGIGVKWLFTLVQLSIFAGDIMWGARVVGGIVGLSIAVMGVVPTLFISERTDRLDKMETVKRVPILKSWGLTFRDRDFVVLCFSTILIYGSILLVNTLGWFLSVFYVFGGDKQAASVYIGWGGTIFNGIGIVCIPWVALLAKKVGKRRAFELCIFSVVLGGVLKYFVYFPESSWLILIPNLFLAPGLLAAAVLIPSMMGDVAARDEERNGSSRQGMYAASMSWVTKLSISGIFAVAGYVLVWIGWDNDKGVDQVEGTFENMRLVFSLGTIGLALTAAGVLRFYTLGEGKGS